MSNVQKVSFDLFPAHVALAPEGLLEDPLLLSSAPASAGSYYISVARVLIFGDRVVVVQEFPSQGAVVVFNEAIKNFYKAASRDQDSIVITVSGKILAFKKDSSCGCGSRLRSWNPYRVLYSNKD